MKDYSEKARKFGVPVIPALPEQDIPNDTNPVVAICGECGREVHRMESYYCPNGRCPIQVKFT